MMRQEYIAELEEIRKQTIKIGQAFASVDLTDATGMERDRRKKTAKLVGDLADRLYEDIAISAKVAADNAEAGIGEQGDLFDDKDVPPCKHHDGEGCTNKKAPCSDGLCDGKDDGCPCYKAGKGKRGKKGGKA